jgi:hypothetical protein
VALLVGWWAIAFAGNFAGIRALSSGGEAVLAGTSDLATLEALRSRIESESASLNILRRGGLGGGLKDALRDAREIFVWGFGREFEVPTKVRLKGVVRGADDQAFEALARLAQDVTWLGARADEESALRPNLIPYAPISKSDTELIAFRVGYDDFVRWLPDEEIRVRIDREREIVAGAAARLLDLRRLESWSESSEESYPPARYSEPGVPVPRDSTAGPVAGAYTRAAWEGLVSGLIEAVDRTGGASSTAVNAFRRGYVTRFDNSWRSYLLDTPMPPREVADVRQSPYLELIEQIHVNSRAELPREGSAPAWIAALREVRREEPEEVTGDEPPPPPPWHRYHAALDQVAADVAGAQEQGEMALDLALRMADKSQTSFGESLLLVRELVPTEGDPVAAAKLREILSMPILNGASAVLGLALDELDRRWRDRIAVPFEGSLNTQRMESLYGAGSGQLSSFHEEALGRFYADGRAVAVIGKRSLPFGPEFLRWMKAAEGVQRALYPGGLGGAPRISARLEGIPSRVASGTPVRVARREIRMSCDEGVQTFRYREGIGSHSFLWSPDCTELSLRIWALNEQGREVELLPKRGWSGPLALPDFLHGAQRRSGKRFQWTLRYQEPETEVVVQYRLRGGDGILAVAHTSPPRSLRN